MLVGLSFVLTSICYCQNFITLWRISDILMSQVLGGISSQALRNIVFCSSADNKMVCLLAPFGSYNSIRLCLLSCLASKTEGVQRTRLGQSLQYLDGAKDRGNTDDLVFLDVCPTYELTFPATPSSAVSAGVDQLSSAVQQQSSEPIFRRRRLWHSE